MPGRTEMYRSLIPARTSCLVIIWALWLFPVNRDFEERQDKLFSGAPPKHGFYASPRKQQITLLKGYNVKNFFCVAMRYRGVSMHLNCLHKVQGFFASGGSLLTSQMYLHFWYPGISYSFWQIISNSHDFLRPILIAPRHKTGFSY